MVRWLVLAVVCLVVGRLAVLLGESGANGVAWLEQFDTPAGRMGWRLDKPEEADAQGWPTVEADLRDMHFRPPEDEALRLLLTLRGVGQGGKPDWQKAEQLCRRLEWARCDRAALERMEAMP